MEGTRAFSTSRVGRRLLVKVQVTVSPPWMSYIALAELRSPELSRSVQVMSVRSHPDGTVSVTAYCPGATSALVVSPSAKSPGRSPEKVKVPDAPSGCVCFSTTMLPRKVFSKVQVTVSPASSWMEVGLLPPEQVVVRPQPLGTVSVTE